MSERSLSRLSRTPGTVVGAALVALLCGSAVAVAAPGPSISPSSGPATGGTIVQVQDPPGFRQVAVASDTGFGLDDAGRAFAWGSGAEGQLGNGTTENSFVPVQVLQGEVPDGVTFVELAAATNANAYGLGSDGWVYSWGAATGGALGNGVDDLSISTSPVAVLQGEVPAGVTFTEVTAGLKIAFGLGTDGWIYSWGSTYAGGLGNGVTSSPTSFATPVAISRGEVPVGVTFTQVSSHDSTTYALGSDGQAYSWGTGLSSQLGNGTDGISVSTPVLVSRGQMPVGVTVQQVFAGRLVGYALGSDGHFYSWGEGYAGKLGTGAAEGKVATPVLVAAGDIPGGVDIVDVVSGISSTYGLGSDGNVYSWGTNKEGSLGIGSAAPIVANQPIAISRGAIPVGVRIVSINAKGQSVLAAGSDGRVYSWGSAGVAGVLGSGVLSADQTAPVLGPNFVHSGVSFDGVPGTDLAPVSDSVLSVTTPAHAAGVVDVAVMSKVFGGVTDAFLAISRVLPSAFTFLSADVAPTITTLTLPDTTVDASYDASIAATGTAPITFAVTSGVLPDGLVLDAQTGAITGTATQAGTFTFTVTATNAAGADTREFTLTVNATPTPTPTVAPTSPATTASPGSGALATTGAGAWGGPLGVGALALALGCALVLGVSRIRHARS